MKTRTTSGLLDLIDRMQPNGGNGTRCVKRESVLDSDAMLTVGLPPKPVIDSPVPALVVEADSDEPASEEKTND